MITLATSLRDELQDLLRTARANCKRELTEQRIATQINNHHVVCMAARRGGRNGIVVRATWQIDGRHVGFNHLIGILEGRSK